MKFEKIGVSTSGGKDVIIDEKNLPKSDYLNFVTSCKGEKVKWNDPTENDAVNLIVTWKVELRHDNNFPVWDKTHSQHYRIKEKEIPATNEVMDKLIEDSWLDFRIYLENENDDPENILSVLASTEIEETRLRLLEECNS